MKQKCCTLCCNIHVACINYVVVCICLLGANGLLHVFILFMQATVVCPSQLKVLARQRYSARTMKMGL